MTLPSAPEPTASPPPDDAPRLRPQGWLDQAPVTRMLLALNVCVFIAEVAISRSATVFSTRQMLAMGASYSLATIGESRYETLITAAFLHAGVLHLAFNMVALWQAGPLVERAVGSARMAPMYLAAGAVGNLLSVLVGWFRDGGMTVGASGAISGVIAAALVVGWRTGGWRSPLTQAMARWLGFVVVFGILSNLSGGNIDNAAHIGGAIAGAIIAALWKRGQRYSSRATAAILGGCCAILVGCIAVVAIRDRDHFASMDMQARVEFTADAVSDGTCRDAQDGLAAIERLSPKAGGGRSGAPVYQQVRQEVEQACGRQPSRAR